jgi:hypothetical protein
MKNGQGVQRVAAARGVETPAIRSIRLARAAGQPDRRRAGPGGLRSGLRPHSALPVMPA